MEQVRALDGEQAYEKMKRAMEKAEQEKAMQVERARQVERYSKLQTRMRTFRLSDGPQWPGAKDFGRAAVSFFLKGIPPVAINGKFLFSRRRNQVDTELSSFWRVLSHVPLYEIKYRLRRNNCTKGIVTLIVLGRKGTAWIPYQSGWTYTFPYIECVFSKSFECESVA